MNLSHLDDYGVWVAAVVAGLGAIGWLSRHLMRTYSKTYKWFKETAGRIDGILVVADYQLNNNGGGSLIDKVEKGIANDRRIEEKVDAISAQFAEHINAQTDVLQSQSDTLQAQAEAGKALWPAVQAIAEAQPPV